MTVSTEYLALLQTLLVNGYQNTYYYYAPYSSSGQSFTINFNFPSGITVVAVQNGTQVATAQASISSIVENGGELSVTFMATFTNNFNANELDLYASSGTTLLYKIASITGTFQSLTTNNLVVEWTITINVNSIFNVNFASSQSSGVVTYQFPINQCKSLSGNLLVYPYFVHLIIAYTLIPNLSQTVKSQFPNIPLATMLTSVPAPTSPQQLMGITAFIYVCNGQPQLCYPVNNGLGAAIILSNVSCTNPIMVPLYQIGNTYLAFMQTSVSVTFNAGNVYGYQIGVYVT